MTQGQAVTEEGRLPDSDAGRSATAKPNLDPGRWVDDHGDFLFSFAMLRLRNRTTAQDVVQETFLAALKSHRQPSSLDEQRAWLVGILKHKIYDCYRRQAREPSFTDLSVGLTDEDEAIHFQENGLSAGTWSPVGEPMDWSASSVPSRDRSAFWASFRRCLAKLPHQSAQAFMLREMDDLATAEMCGLLGITENNLWVILHRARLALRHCLEKNWFNE